MTKWRLKKTLARRLEFLPIERDDVRYAWAGYKSGALVDMAAPFDNLDMTADEFKAAFMEVVTRRYHGAWTLFAETPKGFIPVGMILAFYSHTEHAMSPFMIVGDIVWFPWASARNRIESAVNFFSKIHKDIPMTDYAYGEKNRRFFDTLAKHGIIRRAGTTFNIKRGEAVAIYETRDRS